MVSWVVKDGAELSAKDKYEIIKLRIQVFQVQMDCVYQDADGRDLLEDTYHLEGWIDNVDHPVSYLRMIFKDNVVVIGRVFVLKEFRNMKLGDALLTKALDVIDELKIERGTNMIELHSQYYIRNWYAKHGFKMIGEPFYEAKTKHIMMFKDI